MEIIMGAIFKFTEQYLPSEIDGVFVEIGSDRYEGSTEYYAKLARRVGTEFHTVDISDGPRQRLSTVPDMDQVNWHIASGSQWASEIYPSIGKPIACLYLDNFDYEWDVNLKFDDILEQIETYRREFGIEMNNQNCQVEHLRQMIALMPYMAEKSLVICDDTQQFNECWIGKGGGVVLFLLAHGFQVREFLQSPGSDGQGYGVVLSRN